jgi:hypothetical protein
VRDLKSLKADTRRLCHGGPNGDDFRRDNAIAFARRRNETRSLSLMPAMPVNSGTCGG